MNGANGSKTFVDESKSEIPVSAVGAAALTNSDYRFGPSCATFGPTSSGTTNYLIVGQNNQVPEEFELFGSESWCIECWVKDTRPLTSSLNQSSIISMGIQTGLNFTGWSFGYIRFPDGALSPKFWIGTTDFTPGQSVSNSYNPYYDQWVHLAFTWDKTDGKLRFFVNGYSTIRDGALAYNYIYVNSPTWKPTYGSTLRIGYSYLVASNPGLIDDLRITQGSPRYTKNFTPSRFPAQKSWYNYNTANVVSSLVLNFQGANDSSTFVDTSYMPKPVINFGTPLIKTQQYKFNNSSGYFDGSSYISIPGNPDFEFGTGDYTVEGWVYPIVSSGSQLTAPIRLLRMNMSTLADYKIDYTFEITSLTTVRFFGGSSGGTTTEWFANINANSWTHIAFTRQCGVMKVFVNGVQCTVKSGSANNATNITSVSQLSLPASSNTSGLMPSNPCYIDNLVVTKSVAKYTYNFSVPAVPSSFGPNDVSSIFATLLNMTDIATPSNTNVSVTGWQVFNSEKQFIHTITVTFSNAQALIDYFNAGGEIYLYPAYMPPGVGFDQYLYLLFDGFRKVTISGTNTSVAFPGYTNYPPILNSTVGGKNIGTTEVLLFRTNYARGEGPGFGSITNSYSVYLKANAALGSATVLTIRTVLQIPVGTFNTYSNTYSSTVKYRYSTLAPIPTFSGVLTQTNQATIPSADFSSNVVSGTNPLTVSFNDLSTNSPTSWLWDFKNDGTATSTVRNPSYTYTQPGNYTVKLTATNSAGSNTVTKTNYITVTEVAPIAAFNAAPTSGINPLTVSFTNSSLGNNLTYLWDFKNDGTATSTQTNPTYTYTQNGNYTVKLTATNSAGSNTVTRSNYITVSAVPIPAANFTSNVVSGTVPLTVNFTDTSTNSPTSWLWDFKNDGTATSTVRNPSYTYTQSGTYTVKLTATNQYGSNTVVKTNYITVNAVGPTAAFTANVTSGFAPLSVQFNNSTTGTSPTYLWDFKDDGTATSTLENPSYTYTQPGTYNVKLSATNSSGTNNLVRPAYIKVSTAGTLILTIDTSYIIAGTQDVVIYSTNLIGTVDWGDGTVEYYNNAVPRHTYNVGGVYTITFKGKLTKFSGLHTLKSIDYWDDNLEMTSFAVNRDHSVWSSSQLPGRNFGGTNLIQQVPNYLPTTVTDLEGAFQGCMVFNDSNVISWDTSRVTNMSAIFKDAYAFNQPINNWNVSNVRFFSYAFDSESYFKPFGDLREYLTVFNQPLSLWNTSNATTMEAMFYNSRQFNQNIGNWNVGNVVRMNNMFAMAISFNQNLSSWCVSLIPQKPIGFDSGAGLWTLARPILGTCP
jgi:PKD repeat protein